MNNIQLDALTIQYAGKQKHVWVCLLQMTGKFSILSKTETPIKEKKGTFDDEAWAWNGKRSGRW